MCVYTQVGNLENTKKKNKKRDQNSYVKSTGRVNAAGLGLEQENQVELTQMSRAK